MISTHSAIRIVQVNGWKFADHIHHPHELKKKPFQISVLQHVT